MPSRIDDAPAAGNQDQGTKVGGGSAQPRRNESVAVENVLVRRLKVLFVEDDPSCAAAFRRALAQYQIDVAVAKDLSSARLLLRGLRTHLDAVLLDLDLPDGRGEDLLPEIDAISRQPGIVILSDFLDQIRPEAASYRPILVPKTITPASLAAVLRIAVGGYVQGTLVRFAKRFGLTRRESEILDRLAKGASPKEVALEFDCSMQAVYAHLGRVCTKTNCASYREVVAALFQFSCHGLGRPMWEEDVALGPSNSKTVSHRPSVHPSNADCGYTIKQPPESETDHAESGEPDQWTSSRCEVPDT
jgi:DNA-binding NarL/FixJ family response regulator